MEDDPDDLAAAFFAAQAAKEEQKAKLPIEEWVDAISQLKTADIITSDQVNEWLVTTMPSAVSKNGDGKILLNSNECICNLLQENSSTNDSASALTEAQEKELHATREKLKQALVQKLFDQCKTK